MPNSNEKKLGLNQFYIRYVLAKPRPLLIGVTGHRDLDNPLEEIEAKVNDKLKELISAPENRGRRLVLLSAMAPGADQLVAASFLEAGGEVLVLRTMEDEDFRKCSFTYDGADLRSYEAYEQSLTKLPHIDTFNPYHRPADSVKQQELLLESAKFLVHHAEHLIALWDGVETGAVGGTSHVVRMWLNERNGARGKVLHQLVVPRTQNFFPLGRSFVQSEKNFPPADNYTWVTTPVTSDPPASFTRTLTTWFKKYQVWFYTGVLLLGSIVTFTSFCLNVVSVVAALPILFFFSLAAWFYQRYKHVRDLLLRFIFPMVLGIFVLIFGFIGYANYEGKSKGDMFFAAVDLITPEAGEMDEKIREKIEKGVIQKGDPHILYQQLARLLGGFLAGYAFVLAFALAAGKENLSRFGFWLFRHWTKRSSRNFVVVIGDGSIALHLVQNLIAQKKNIVLLDEGTDRKVAYHLSSSKVWYFNGNMTSREGLRKTYFWLASDTYVVSQDDEENFRIVQEMDEILSEEKRRVKREVQRDSPFSWFVHLTDLQERDLLQNFARTYIKTFSIYENAARRVLQRFPVDRFSRSPYKGSAEIAQVVVFGFGVLGQQIALSAITTGQYCGNRHLKVKVYYAADEQGEVDNFRCSHSELFCQANYVTTPFLRVANHTFFENTQKIIEFERLPEGERGLVDPNFSLYGLVEPEHIVSIYACFSSGIKSAALLGSILPRVQWLKSNRGFNRAQQTDVQVFCFYNFPDKNEEEFIELKLNGIAPSLPVFCFGNFVTECSEAAIRNETIDFVAKQIALLYACLYSDHVVATIPRLKAIVDLVEDETVMTTKEWEKGGFTEELKNKRLIVKAEKLLPYLLIGDFEEIRDHVNSICSVIGKSEFSSVTKAVVRDVQIREYFQIRWKLLVWRFFDRGLKTLEAFAEETAGVLDDDLLNQVGLELKKLDRRVSDVEKRIIKVQMLFARVPDAGVKETAQWLETVWRSLPEDEKESNRQAADHAWIKFREMGKSDFSALIKEKLGRFWRNREKAQLARLEHKRWNAEKLVKGWVPNTESNWKHNKSSLKAQKLHQFMVRFEELPKYERNKDCTQILGLPFFFYNLINRERSQKSVEGLRANRTRHVNVPDTSEHIL